MGRYESAKTPISTILRSARYICNQFSLQKCTFRKINLDYNVENMQLGHQFCSWNFPIAVDAFFLLSHYFFGNTYELYCWFKFLHFYRVLQIKWITGFCTKMQYWVGMDHSMNIYFMYVFMYYIYLHEYLVQPSKKALMET